MSAIPSNPRSPTTPIANSQKRRFWGGLAYIYIYICNFYIYIYIYLYLYIYIFIYTLQRLKVPAKIIKLIQCFYSNPDFKVSVNGIDSDWKKQKTGIRQGCPLSPYLSAWKMSAMFTDIKSELNTPKQRQPFDGISFTEILFADDTLIFGANTHCINVLLHAIERHSAYFGLKIKL